MAYFGPDENYFKWAGPVSFASMGMLAITFMSIRNHQKMRRLQVLYGTVFAGGYTTFCDTKNLMRDARYSAQFDPVMHALMFQYNAISMLLHFIEIIEEEGK